MMLCTSKTSGGPVAFQSLPCPRGGVVV